MWTCTSGVCRRRSRSKDEWGCPVIHLEARACCPANWRRVEASGSSPAKHIGSDYGLQLWARDARLRAVARMRAQYGASMLRMIVLVAVGWIVGLSARVVLPGKGPDGFLATTAIGVGGAIIAAVVGRFAGWWHPGDATGFILSLLGAIMILALYRVLKSKTA